MTDTPRLRFAPSPTGYLHVGGARTALFNWLYARKMGGQLLLRIEDTDKARSTDESTRAIFDGLTWLGLDWDGEVVYQGANVARHAADAHRLLASGHAYCDFTTAAELEAQRAAEKAKGPGHAFRVDRTTVELPAAEVEARIARGDPYAIRFRVEDGTTEWTDLVHERIAFPNKDIEDFIILRSDGTPVYNLAVVSDDIAMGITLVMRGDDHISNTPKQLLLYRALGAELPTFAHLPMIHGTDGKKLSKRHGATAVADWQHVGILPSTMCNFLALLGWSPGGDLEVMMREELIERFNTDGLLRKAAVFDPKKLEWMNGQHLSRLPLADVAERVLPALVAAGLTTDADVAGRRDWFNRLVDLLRVRARTIDDVVRQAVPYLSETIAYDPDAVAKQWSDGAAVRTLLGAAAERLRTTQAWTPEAMESALRALAASEGTTAGKIFQPLRVALTGLSVSPGIFEVLELLGRERATARIEAALVELSERA